MTTNHQRDDEKENRPDEVENGKIKVWRDYFDQGTYMRAMR